MFSLMKPGAAASVTGLLVLATTGADTVEQPHVAQAAQEVHLRNVRQLTFEGENAEAYFSFDGTKLIFQSTPRAGGCDQIYTMSLDGGDVELLSTGQGEPLAPIIIQRATRSSTPRPTTLLRPARPCLISPAVTCGRCTQLRHLRCGRGRLEPPAIDTLVRLRCGGDVFSGGRSHRVHLDAGRRARYLFDETGWIRRPASHGHDGL